MLTISNENRLYAADAEGIWSPRASCIRTATMALTRTRSMTPGAAIAMPRAFIYQTPAVNQTDYYRPLRHDSHRLISTRRPLSPARIKCIWGCLGSFLLLYLETSSCQAAYKSCWTVAHKGRASQQFRARRHSHPGGLGAVLVRLLLRQTMRGHMNSTKSYVRSPPLGEVMISFTVGEVVSKSPEMLWAMKWWV